MRCCYEGNCRNSIGAVVGGRPCSRICKIPWGMFLVDKGGSRQTQDSGSTVQGIRIERDKDVVVVVAFCGVQQFVQG